MLKRKEFILGAAAGLTLAAAATAGGVITWPGAHAEPQAVNRITPVPANGDAFTPPPGAPSSFATIFDQVSPAVVQIDVTVKVDQPQGGAFQIPGLPFQFVINTANDYETLLQVTERIRKRAEEGPQVVISGLTSDQRRAARAGAEVYLNDTKVGTVTSGQPSPTLGHPVAIALLDTSAELEPGTAVEVEIRGKRYPFEVTALPFYKRDK